MNYPALEAFAPYVNTKFVMHYSAENSAELTLVSAVDVGSTPRQIQFSLVFQGPGNGPIKQGVYRLEHEALGSLDVFLVPIARDNGGLSYEAVFNRFVE